MSNTRDRKCMMPNKTIYDCAIMTVRQECCGISTPFSSEIKGEKQALFSEVRCVLINLYILQLSMSSLNKL